MNRQRLLRLNSVTIKLFVRYILRNEKIDENIGVNLMFVRNKVIQKYNKDFLNKDCPTDVICFEDNRNRGSAGDVIISVDMAVEYAGNHNIDVEEELARYVVHGVLHSLGYDDIIKEDKRKMFRRQEKLLSEWINAENHILSLPGN